MRAAYITRAPFISGAERSLQTMLKILPAAGIDPVVFCPPESRIISWCKANEIAVCVCPLEVRDKWHPFRWWSSVRAVRAALRAHHIDLIHSNQVYSYPAAGVAARDLGLPRICHMRDENSTSTLEWFCASGLEAALCISRYVERQTSDAWPQRLRRPWIGTLLNPVDLPPLGDKNQQRHDRRAARERFDLTENEVVFGFIGQIVPVKGLMNLLDAAAGLTDRPGWKILIAGRDPHPGAVHEAECHDRARELGLNGRIQFLGFLEDVSSFYRAIDLAVVPSVVEPLGRVPLEAASYARPSVAYSVGGLPETICDGQTGWLVPQGDVLALRQVMRNFLEGTHAEFGEAARQWIQEVSAPGAYATRLAGIYQNLCIPR